MLPAGERATLIAEDGATVSTVLLQLEQVPADATHLALSAGGNDALWTAGDVFSQQSTDVRSSLQRIAESLAYFTSEFRKLIDAMLEFRLPIAFCTVYDSVPGLGPPEKAGLCLFNDTITRTAFECRATLIDLRSICNDSSDYSPVSPIEPSASGGEKIARALLSALSDSSDFRRVIAR